MQNTFQSFYLRWQQTKIFSSIWFELPSRVVLYILYSVPLLPSSPSLSLSLSLSLPSYSPPGHARHSHQRGPFIHRNQQLRFDSGVASSSASARPGSRRSRCSRGRHGPTPTTILKNKLKICYISHTCLSLSFNSSRIYFLLFFKNKIYIFCRPLHIFLFFPFSFFLRQTDRSGTHTHQSAKPLSLLYYSSPLAMIKFESTECFGPWRNLFRNLP